MGTETQRYPGVGAAVMLGFGVGMGTAIIAGNSASTARATARRLGNKTEALLARDLTNPTARRIQDARVQMLRLEQASPLQTAQRNGRAAIAGAVLAVASLAGGAGFAATRP